MHLGSPTAGGPFSLMVPATGKDDVGSPASQVGPGKRFGI